MPRMNWAIPELRVTQANDHPLRSDGNYVVYWMTASRRAHWNFALQHAVDRAIHFDKPLLVFEPLRIRYPWASERLHRFVVEGMRDNAADFAATTATYFPYVEPRAGEGTPLLHELAKQACTVITDEFPCFFLPSLIRAVQDRIPARLELVDSNGVLPLRLADRTFTVAHSYRRWMQKQMESWLGQTPLANPLDNVQLPRLSSLPKKITHRWQPANFDQLLTKNEISLLPLRHLVPSVNLKGGAVTAQKMLRHFLAKNLINYNEDRNQPDCDGSTGLSAHLHFGHISAHQIVAEILAHEHWNPSMLGKPNGKNHDFWNTSPSAEALLDQLLTWREMGFNMSFRNPDSYDKYESLPDWAQATLAAHAADKRPFLYSLEQFERAETHDEIWNAAQRQLTTDGRMHNYLRMLWGKMILHWSESPQQALATMIELNNKYALDGRDPNSYSGIFWTLGRFDRAWGPRRPVFGSVRYMTSDSTRRKLKLKQYLSKWGNTPPRSSGQANLF